MTWKWARVFENSARMSLLQTSFKN